MTGQFILLGVLILVNASLAGTEMAIVSLRESQIARLADTGPAGARLARLAENPTQFLAAIQVGVTIAGFLASASAAVSLADPAADAIRPVVGDTADRIVVPFVTLILAYLTLVLGELAPKRLAMQYAERWALLSTGPLTMFVLIARPVVWVLSMSTNVVVRLLGGDPNAATEGIGEDELRDLVVGHEGLDPEQRSILAETFDAATRIVGQVLVPRTSVFVLDSGDIVGDARAALVDNGHSRAPVCDGGNLDACVGIVHLRDLLGNDTDLTGTRAGPITVIPETLLVLEALAMLRAERSQFALVVDEHGGGAGIVTVEDLLEEIVGDIYDETDRDIITVSREDNTTHLLGGFPVHDLDDIDLTVPPGPYSTVAGFLLAALGRVPDTPGAVVERDGIRWEVTGVNRRTITSVSATPLPDAESSSPSTRSVRTSREG